MHLALQKDRATSRYRNVRAEPTSGFCSLPRPCEPVNGRVRNFGHQRDSIRPTGDLTDMPTSRDTLMGTLVGHFRRVISVGEKRAVHSFVY